MSRATIIVEGNAAAPRLAETQNGRSIVTVAVGHTPRKKTDRGWEDAGPTTWFEAAFWDADGDTVRGIQKGDRVILTGQPEINVFAKQDGTPAGTIRVRFASIAVVPRAEQVSSPDEGGWADGSADTPF